MGPDRPSTVRWVFALVALTLLAFALRVISVGFGLPGVYNPDETPILNRALAFATGNLNPHVFVYPTLYFYALFAWEGLYFAGGWLAGAFDSVAAFQRQFFLDPSGHFVAARMFSVVCGTATIPALFWFGRRLYDVPTGLAAAALLSVAPIAVRDAHYVKLDVPVTLLVVLAHGALARIVVDEQAAARKRTWIIAGVLSGAAVSTQYYAVFIAFTILAVALVHFARSRNAVETVRLLSWCAAAAAVAFFAGTPFLIVDFQKALADVAHVREVDVDRAVIAGAFSPVAAYLRMLLHDAVGWPVWLAAVIGGVWALVVDWRRGLLVVTFFLTYFVFITNTVPMSRYLNVVLPLITLSAGFALVRFARFAGPYKTPAGTMLLVLAMIPALISSIKTDLFFRQADTRSLARRFIESTVPAGQSVLIQPYSVPLHRTRESVIEAFRKSLGSESRASTKFQQMLALEPYPSPAYRLIFLGDDDGFDVDKVFVSPRLFGARSLLPLRRLGVRYVILKQSNTPNPSLEPLESALASEGRRLATFSPYHGDATAADRTRIPPFLHNTAARIEWPLERPGPIVEIWELGQPD